ncbi:MAG: Sister chromatid cohesion protein 2 [Trizodia sp. TS-e1964]|nr:MAG: Sister chromatid cohesion protein 2 [Trizodia sp. TS-e1964]
MLLEATSVSYNYGLKAKPLPKSKKNKSPKVPKKPQLPQQLPITSTNHNAIHHNAQITLEASQGFPQRTIPEPVVIVPGLPSSSQHDDYETFPEVDAMMVKENKELVSRKHNKLDTQRGTTQVRDSDRMAKSEGILIGLKELIGEIFEAEDQMQSDTSGQKSTNASNLFDSAASGDVEILTLAAPALAKLDSLISNLSAADRFSEIPAEDLCRLQKLCEGSLHTAESLDLRLENARGEYDIDRWLVLLSLADSGLKSSKTLLRMMTAGREEKQLYSEEMLQSILGVLKNILESCLIPTAELRRSGPTLELFKLIHPHNKYLSSLLIQSSKVLRLLALLFSKEKVDNAITTVLFLSTQLIFVENAHSDKDSVFGVQKFENLRVAAMDVLAKIFLKHTDQRTFIFDEILTSLEKLPITRQSARQYKLIEGKNIQLVSALIMRLVQTSALPCDDSFGISSRKYSTDNAEKEEEDGSSDQDGDGIVVINEEKASSHPNSAIQSLSQLTKPLLDSAYRNAHFIVKFIVARALKSTKTGDAPYRNLLDIFAEDFIAVLNSTDWPAAELLLQQLLSTMIGISGDEKQPAPAKTMALDLMGLMGSAIADINTQIRQMTNSIEKNDTNLSGIVAQLAEESLEGKIREYDMLAWDGPQRAILEHLDERDLIDEQLQSASGFLTTQWSNSVCKYFESADEDEADESEIGELGILAYRLRKMNLDRKWLREE